MVQSEILRLLRAEAKILHSKGAKLKREFSFQFTDDDLLRGPIGRQMRMVFDHVRGAAQYDHMEVLKCCFEIISFIWPSEFTPHYSIPEEFWDTPMGFAIYEIVGKLEDPPLHKELSSVQAAKFLGVTLNKLNQLVAENKIRIYRKEGKNARFLVKDLAEFKQNSE